MLLDAFGHPLAAPGGAPRVVARTDAVGTVSGPVARSDRWVNMLTGIGTMIDKTRAGFFDSVWRIPDQELTNLANGSDLAAKIIEKRPNEMFRRGFDLKANENGKKGGGRAARGKAAVDASAVQDFLDYCSEELQLTERFKSGMRFGRQYGGTLLLLGVDDGQDPAEPINEDRLRSFKFINVIDRRFCWVNSYYADPNDANFSEPQTYMISNGVAATDYRPSTASRMKKKGWTSMIVHESRVIRFDGVATDMLTRQTLAGWSWSILQRVYEVLRQFDHGFDAATYLLSDASQGIFKLKGLLNAISSGNKAFLEARLLAMEETRSVLRAVAVDADERSGESFTRIATPMTGIPEMLDRLMQRVSAGADMPVQELFGAGSGGLNAAGEAQAATRKWYDTIATERGDQVDPKLTRLYRLAALAGDSPLGKKDVRWKIDWHALWEPTDEELAKTRLTNAQRDQIYVAEGIVPEEAVALTLKEIYPALDEEAIEAAIKAKETFDPHENDPMHVKVPIGPDGKPMPLGKVPPQPPALPGAAPGQPAPGQAGPGGPPQGATGGPVPPLKAMKVPGGQRPSPLPGGNAPPQPHTHMLVPQKKSVVMRSALVSTSGGEPGARTLPAPGPYQPEHRRNDSVADAVHAQLAEDYDDPAISWTKAAKWKGPRRVDVSKIDFSNKEKWSASHDLEKVDRHAARIAQGIEKPIVLVKTPHSRKLAVADGHHRALAYLGSGKPARAYIATVHAAHGPWDTMHAEQKETGLEASTQSQKGDGGDDGPAARRADYSPDQARAENGQFGEGGGGKSGGKDRPVVTDAVSLRDRFFSDGDDFLVTPPHIDGDGDEWLATTIGNAVADALDAYAEGLKDDSGFDEAEHPRDETGKFTSEGGGSAAKSEHTKTGGLRTALHAIASGIRKAPLAIGRAALHEAKEKIAEFKEAGLGIKAFLTGHPVSAGQKSAMKKVVVFAVTAVMAAHAVPMLRIGEVLHGALTSRVTEKVADEATHLVFEKLARRGLRLDYSDDEPRDDFSEDQPRDGSGRWSPEGGNGKAPLFHGVGHLPSNLHQPLASKGGLYAQAKRAQAQLVNIMDHGHGLDRALGARVVMKEKGKEVDLDKPGPVIVIGRIKDPERAEAKVQSDYHGDWSRVGDLVRASIAVDSPKEIPTVLTKLHEAGLDPVRRPKDRFSRPGPAGYRDAQMNVRLPNGHIGEIQVHVKSMLAAKNGAAHSVYARVQEIERASKGRKPTRAELGEIKAANARMKAVYDAAWEKAGGRLDSFDPDEPRDEHGQWTSGGGGGAAAKALTSLATKHGGFSYRPFAGTERVPKDGYMVSLPPRDGYNHVVDYQKLAASGLKGDALRAEVEKQVEGWLQKAAPFVDKTPDHYLGGWIQHQNEDGTGPEVAFHLDVSQRFAKEHDAVRYSQERNQVAAWDVKNFKEIPTGGTGKELEPHERLPQDHARYFHADPAARDIPLKQLETTRARPAGITRAAEHMRAASAGTGDKRGPISVRRSGEHYEVVSGNSTTAVARIHGWSSLPAVEVK